MGKAIQLKTRDDNGSVLFWYYVNPPLVNGYMDQRHLHHRQSHLVLVRFFPTEAIGIFMEVTMLDELLQVKNSLSFEYYEHLLKDFNPEKLDPVPFFKAIGYEEVIIT